MQHNREKADEPSALGSDVYYSIKTVSRLTGVNSATIRSWERRYGLIAPARDANGRRTYSEDDICKLRMISELVRTGHPIGEIAPMTTELLQDLQEDADTGHRFGRRNPVFERLMTAVSAKDADRFRLVLGKALSTFEPLEVVQEVIAPVLREIGDRWERGLVSIGQEHALSAITKQLLFASVNTITWHSNGPSIVIATPGKEPHEFGSLLAYFLASSYGAKCTYLGPDLPAEELADAASMVNADVVALSVIHPETPDISAFLRKLDEALPPTIPVWLGAGPHAGVPNGGLPERVVMFGSYEPFILRLTAMTK